MNHIQSQREKLIDLSQFFGPLIVVLGLILSPVARSADSFDIPFAADDLQAFSLTSIDPLYLAPNEPYPYRAMPIFNSARQGAYVSVGTERGFLSAAASAKVDHLILVDREPQVVLYNRINTLLLMIAENRSHYLYLRMNPVTAWAAAARRADLPESYIFFLNRYSNQWKKAVVENVEFKRFTVEASTESQPFYGLNYLFNDSAFLRLQTMAREGRIFSDVVNFENLSQVRQLASWLSENKIELSVLDISNAWWKIFIHPENFVEMVSIIDSVAKPDSLLALTGVSLFGALPQMVTEPMDFGWQYHAFNFKKIREFKNIKEFRKYISWKTLWSRPWHTVLHLSEPSSCADIIFQKP